MTENWNNEKEFEKDIKRINPPHRSDQIERYEIKKFKLIILLMFKKVTTVIDKFLSTKNTVQARNVVIILDIIKNYYPGAKEYAEIIISA